MRLRPKISLAIMAIAMVPLLALALHTHKAYRDDLSAAVLSHLESVAAIQEARLSAVLDQNLERLALVASRTQLRLNLRRELQQPDPANVETMSRILRDAAASIPDLLDITVYSPDRVAVASTDRNLVGRPHFDDALFEEACSRSVVDRLHLDASGNQRIHLTGPMQMDGQLLGVMVITAEVDNLLSSIADYSGLQMTGETLLVGPDGEGTLRFLAPTRFDADAALRTAPGAAARAVRQGGLTRDSLDYRGHRVLAVGRVVPQTPWTVEVKLDRQEAFANQNRAFATGAGLLAVLLLVVGVAGTAFAARMSAPLVELGEAAGALAAGDYGRRVPVRSADEIGSLERDFNAMAEQIAESRQALEAQVTELNAALAEIKTLKGIIPICSGCKKIRDDQGYWNQLEAYLLEHSEAAFSHGLCPECVKIYDPDYEEDKTRP